MLQEARGELQRIVADAISQAATANTQATERAAEQIRQAGETAAARIQQEAAISARRFRRATLVAVVCSLTALAASVSTIVRLVAG
jgi:F0F1-type ATP synthase membrane subunit b/b'